MSYTPDMAAPQAILFGANGFLGPHLAEALQQAGLEVVTVSRHQTPAVAGCGHEVWDGRTQGPWAKRLEGAALVINLAGRSINCRHTPENLRQILSSRIDSTRAVGDAIAACEQPPRVWMNASTGAIYQPVWGDAPAATETAPPCPGEELRDVGIAWEQELMALDLPQTRRLALRISVVLGNDGALPVLQRITRLGLGGRAGSGKQWMSWIAVQDLCAAIVHAYQHEELQGAINLGSPHPVTNAEFMAEMRRVLRRPIGLPAPAFGIKIGAKLAGSEAKLVLESMKIRPEALLQSGFTFTLPTLDAALESLLPVS